MTFTNSSICGFEHSNRLNTVRVGILLSLVLTLDVFTVWSNMIVIKVFSYKTLKIELRGSIFDLNSTQVWAIMCKSAIIKINSLFHQNLGTINECSNWREPQTKLLLSITILKIGPCLVRFLLMLYSWAVSRDSNCGQFRFFEFRA